MPEPEPRISILDARLAEIDRRLETIQTGLLTEEPAPEAVGATPAATPAAATLRSASDSGGATPITGAPATDEPADTGPASTDKPADTGPAPTDRPTANQLIAELRALTGAHERLLDSMQKLLSASEQALASGSEASSGLAGSVAAPGRELSVSAGPLSSTEALREFERALSLIPEVRQVEVRGYEAGDRAIIDVHLFDRES